MFDAIVVIMKTSSYGLEEGIAKLPELARGSRTNIFGINDEALLKEILSGETYEELDKSWKAYLSKTGAIVNPGNPYPINALLLLLHGEHRRNAHQLTLLFGDEELPQKYKAELKMIKQGIPTSRILLKKGRFLSRFSPEWEPEGVGYSFGVFDKYAFVLNHDFKNQEFLIIEQPLDIIRYGTLAPYPVTREPYPIHLVLKPSPILKVETLI